MLFDDDGISVFFFTHCAPPKLRNYDTKVHLLSLHRSGACVRICSSRPGRLVITQ